MDNPASRSKRERLHEEFATTRRPWPPGSVSFSRFFHGANGPRKQSQPDQEISFEEFAIHENRLLLELRFGIQLLKIKKALPKESLI